MGMRIYWHSSAPWGPSSYSVLTRRAVPHLVRGGYKVALGTFYGLQGEPIGWPVRYADGSLCDTVTVLPAITSTAHNAGTIRPSLRRWNCDLAIVCADVWIFEPEHTQEIKFCPWLPVDHDPVPRAVVECLREAFYPMVYSQWGVDLLGEAGIDAHYVPGSAPADVFMPGDSTKAAERLAIPAECDFLAVMVAANKDGTDRKGFGPALRGFAKFAAAHPRAYLYLHTRWDGALNIMAMVESLGLRGRVLHPDQYAYDFGLLDENYMADVYRAGDILLNPCKGEGFGLPLIEAQMCGTPVAAADFATTDELLFGGWKLSGQLEWSDGADSWRYAVSADSVAAVLEEAYRERNLEELGAVARAKALIFDDHEVWKNYWRPALAEMERRLK